MARDPKEVRLAALHRRTDGPKTLKVFNAKADDWRTVCRKCGEVIEGTLVEIKEHTCNG